MRTWKGCVDGYERIYAFASEITRRVDVCALCNAESVWIFVDLSAVRAERYESAWLWIVMNKWGIRW